MCVTHAVLSQMPQELFMCPELVSCHPLLTIILSFQIKMVVTNTVNQVSLYPCHCIHQTQDYSGCHESITEKLVVIDVSDVIGEAIRWAGRSWMELRLAAAATRALEITLLPFCIQFSGRQCPL